MFKQFIFLLTALFVFSIVLRAEDPARSVNREEKLPVRVYCPADSSPLELLAAREVQRYLYLRSGTLPSIERLSNSISITKNAIIIARKDRTIWDSAELDPMLRNDIHALVSQQYRLQTLSTGTGRRVVIAGGDDTATLYAAYAFSEKLGVRFYLHGDVVPDRSVSPLRDLPFVNETGRPLFELRGIQPFHDFPEGPDWWNTDDYLAIIAQLPKLRMNFIGLHTYPEGGPNAEPTVWIGLPGDLDEKGKVKFSYPSSYQNTARTNWGYSSRKTSEFNGGGSQLFERDAFGGNVMVGLCPEPATPEGSNELFERTGNMLRRSFGYAHQLGIKTCVGTETPLTIPQILQEHLKALNKNPSNPEVVQELYKGVFQRIMKTYPLDYYWFWTPETWTWEGTRPDQIKATTNDLMQAMAAANKVNASFTLATCGWVLGPPGDRSLFNHFLPREMPMSCINREVGKTPVEPGFARVQGRPKWAIPWLEDDPALTSPQLWVGRMRQDAVDSLDYGCSGLLGIHWRTRSLSPNVSALAKAAWEQNSWRAQAGPTSGWIGGKDAKFPDNTIAETSEQPIYQTVRYGMSALRLAAPNGSCKVTLKFCEPHFDAAGKRVFGVKIQGKTVLDRFDIFALAGKNKAIDFTYPEVPITNGILEITFEQQVESPSIAAVVIEGAGFSRKINCGGPAWKDYAADLPELPRHQPAGDFYLDWASQEFGPEAGILAARIFSKIDGNLPRPSDWVDGPGNLKADTRPWNEVSKEYAFVGEFEALRFKVRGPGNKDRYEYWLNFFQYMRAMARANCDWGLFNKAMDTVRAEPDSAAKILAARANALPARGQMIASLQEVYAHLLAYISNPGELGTLANFEQHVFVKMLKEPGEELSKILDAPLPADAQMSSLYHGPARVIVPTVRGSVGLGEPLRLKVLVLAEKAPQLAVIRWRPMGLGTFSTLPLQHAARGVFTVQWPAFPAGLSGIEYYVEVKPAMGKTVRFPATAPQMNQTVVIHPGNI
jgi:hypothetical protein